MTKTMNGSMQRSERAVMQSYLNRFEAQVSIQAPHSACRTLATKMTFFKAQIRLLPQTSGVYKMLDKTGKIIYIGKAKNLRHRVASYFHARQDRLVTQLLVTRIQALDYVVTITEKDALILENILIKRHQPFFNIDLKDKKTYPYLWLTTHEKFPRLVKTREVTDQGTYFGPYTDVKKVNVYLDVLNSLFALKKCRQTRFPKGFKPCLYYHIGKCLDYCTGSVTQETIQALNSEIKTLLRGNLQEVVLKLEEKMKQASANLNYELALTIRNACTTLKAIDSEQTISTFKEDSFDVFHYNVSAGWLVISLLMFRGGRLVDKGIFQFKNALWGSVAEHSAKTIENTEDITENTAENMAEHTAENTAENIEIENFKEVSAQNFTGHNAKIFFEKSAEEIESELSPRPSPVTPYKNKTSDPNSSAVSTSTSTPTPTSTSTPTSIPTAEEISALPEINGANEENLFATAERLQFIVEAFSQFFFEYYQTNDDSIGYIVLPEDLLNAQGARELLTNTIREARTLSQSHAAIKPLHETEATEVIANAMNNKDEAMLTPPPAPATNQANEKQSKQQSKEGLTPSSPAPPVKTMKSKQPATVDSENITLTRGRKRQHTHVGADSSTHHRDIFSDSHRGSEGLPSSPAPKISSDAASIINEQHEIAANSTPSIKIPNLITGLRGPKKRFLKLAKANADQSFYNMLYQHKKQQYLKRLKEVLNLDKIPSIIDAFDVANTGDRNLVAACVRFVDGNPDKQHYRLFNIQSTQQQNDFLSMAEAVYRRYHRWSSTEKSGLLPQLILIDGGKGQLNAAHKSLIKLGLRHISLIALAKQEELVFTLTQQKPIAIRHTDEALRYLVRVRNEVHRFVNKHHKNRRDKEMLKSSFSQIPGLGPKKINTLLTHFDSLAGLKFSSREYVTSLPYIGNKDYDLLIEFFKKQRTSQQSAIPIHSTNLK